MSARQSTLAVRVRACGRPGPSLSDDRAINFGAASVFTQQQPHDEPWDVYQNRLLIQEMFKEAGQTDLPWPHLRDHSPAQNFRSWAEDNLFN